LPSWAHRDTVFGDTWRRPATSEVRRYVGLLVRLIVRHPFTVVVPVEDFLLSPRETTLLQQNY